MSHDRPQPLHTLREIFVERGYVVLRRAFAAQLLDRHTAEFAAFLLRSPQLNGAAPADAAHPAVSARRSAFHWCSAPVLHLVMHEVITDTLRTLLREEPYLLHMGTLNRGEGGDRLHDFLTLTSGVDHVNVWIALKDVGADGGPLWIAPGSQRITENHFERVLTEAPALAERLAVMRDAGASLQEWRSWESDVRAVSDRLLEQYVREWHLPRLPLLLGRGDVVIFHQRLIHGVVRTPGSEPSRWCVVAQFGAFNHPRSEYFRAVPEE